MTDRMDEWSGAPDPEGENVLEAFIEYLNARDLDGVAELVSEEVASELFGGPGADALLQGLSHFFLRQPTFVATRGDLGEEPVVVGWVVDNQSDDYLMLGYFTFTFVEEDGEHLIHHIEYVDQPTDLDDLLVEEPDADEIAEWEDLEDWDGS